MQVGTLSVVMGAVGEAAVSAGAEVSGVPASASQTPANGRFVLLRQATRLHGPAAVVHDELGLDTEGQYRVWVRLMTDGTAEAGTGSRSPRQAARPSGRSS